MIPGAAGKYLGRAAGHLLPFCVMGLLLQACLPNDDPNTPRDGTLVAVAGPDASYGFEDSIRLDASKSHDPGQQSLTYIWWPPPDIGLPFRVISDSPVVWLQGLPKGRHVFTLTVHDGNRESRPVTVAITVLGPHRIVTRNPRYLGVANRYPFIRDALQAAQNGDTILIDTGTYVENLVIDKQGLTLIGKSPGVVLDNRQTGTRPVIRILGARGIRLESLTVKGSGLSAQAAIIIDASDSIVLAGCKVMQNLSLGIRLMHSNAVVLVSDSLMENGWGAIQAIGSDITVLGSVFRENGQDSSYEAAFGALYHLEKGDIRLVRNKFLDSRSGQIHIYGPVNAVLEGNRFEDVGEGVHLGEGSEAHLAMKRNVFRRIDRSCLWCEGATGATVSMEGDSLSSLHTPLWCNGALELAINGLDIEHSDSTWRKHEKGVDLAGCKSVKFDSTAIHGFMIGMILNEVDIRLRGNTFSGDSLCICNQKTVSLRSEDIQDNDLSNCRDPIIVQDCLDKIPDVSGMSKAGRRRF